MKKFLGIIIISLMWFSNSYSEQLSTDQKQEENPFAELEALNSTATKKKSIIDFSQLEGVTPVNNKEFQKWAEEAKNINGKKLYCANKSYDDYRNLVVLEFKYRNRVKVSGIDLENEKIIELYGRYKALSDEIIVNYTYDKTNIETIISRKYLTIKQSSGSYCKRLDDDESVSDKLNLMLNEKIIDKSQSNKF